jgi:hypothetical protein
VCNVYCFEKFYFTNIFTVILPLRSLNEVCDIIKQKQETLSMYIPSFIQTADNKAYKLMVTRYTEQTIAVSQTYKYSAYLTESHDWLEAWLHQLSSAELLCGTS